MSVRPPHSPQPPPEPSADRACQLKRLRALVEQLQQQLKQQQQENQQQSREIEEYAQTVQRQQQQIEKLEASVQQLLQRFYGPRPESWDPHQLPLFDMPAESEEASPQANGEPIDCAAGPASEPCAGTSAQQASSSPDPTASQDAAKRQGHGRRKLSQAYPHVERREVVHAHQQEECCCGECGGPLHEINRQTSEQFEYEPAKLIILEHVQIKYGCRQCETIETSPKPPQPIPKGMAGPGLLAHVTVSKLGDHQPLYRLEDQLMRLGVHLRRSTLAGWLAAAAELAQPLIDRMTHHLVQSRVIHTDDTWAKMLEEQQPHTVKVYFWPYVGDAQHPYTVFDFTTTRQRDGPAAFLRGYQGYLHCDGYSGYGGMARQSLGQIVLVGCWAHALRYFREASTSDPARAHKAMAYIGRLYDLERELKDVSEAERLAQRQARALPILESLYGWLEEIGGLVLPKSPLGPAVTYALNQREALWRYTEAGYLAIDNNLAERTVKLVALGRKNWMFLGSEEGGQRAAVLYSLIATCKANLVEPQAYLTDVFTRLPTIEVADTQSLDALLADRWLASHPQHRWEVAEIRRRDRERYEARRQERRAARRAAHEREAQSATAAS